MNELFCNSLFFGVALSILAYEVGLWLKRRFYKGIFNPQLIAILLTMGVLVVLRVDYSSYNQGAQLLSYLLTPATVCLAIPLYQQLELLKQNTKAIILGLLAGVLSALGSVWVFALLFQLSHQQYVTLLPKSTTTAIGIGLAEEMGGMVTITVAAIILTGLFGNMLAGTICKLFRIEEPIAKGIAIGTASHAMGTVKAIEMGPVEGAMSSLALAVSGLFTVVGASIFALFW